MSPFQKNVASLEALLSAIALFLSANAFCQDLVCQSLPSDEKAQNAWVDALNDKCLKGGRHDGVQWVWGPEGKPANEPALDFFNQLASCFEQQAKNSPNPQAQAHALYFQATVLGIASSVYDQDRLGEKAYGLFKKSFEMDPGFRPALLSFADALSTTVLGLKNSPLKLALAGPWLGTRFTTDLAELQAAVSALPAADPEKNELNNTLSQVAMVLKVPQDPAR
jgi:hypothetical protein